MAKPRPRRIQAAPALAGVAAAPPQPAPACAHFIAACAIFTALPAGGSCGLIGHPLRHAGTFVGLLAILVAGFPTGAGSLRKIGTLALFAILAGYLSISTSMIVGALGVLVLVCGICIVHLNWSRTLRPIAIAIFVFTLYRFARESIPTFWQFTDKCGHFLGWIGASIASEPLNTGATFSGLDALILMLAFGATWTAQSQIQGPRLRRGIFVFTAIALAHLLYLFLLARLHFDPTLTPWNVPLLCALIHATLTIFILRWSKPNPDLVSPGSTSPAVSIAIAAIAIALPIVCTLCWTPLTLADKKIVFYKQGFLNWMKPQWGDYGRLGQGMYGLLANSSLDMSDKFGGTGSRFLELYGAKAMVSPELSDEDLKDADSLVMLYPDKPWKPGQLDRIKNYIENGGTLLLFGEHTICDRKDDPFPNRNRWPGEAISRFNDLLRDSQMRVKFDSAVFTVGGWLQSYEALSHPITQGVRDDRNEFGVVIGASLDVRWPARPIIVGKFGISDPGDEGRSDHAMLGNEQYEPGERLGDVVLCAEQNIGAGRIVLFGDTSMMSNGLLHGCHDFDARLLAYVTNRTTTSQAFPRQIAGMVLLAAMLLLLALQPHPLRLAASALLFAASISICTAISHDMATLLPDGRAKATQQTVQPNNLVYMDNAHLEAASMESWRDTGTMGVALSWERSGYMTLTLPELTRERLERAGVLISVAPVKPFTSDERKTIVEWVNNGGTFICTAGYDRAEASRELLADFGMYVGAKPGDAIPEPLGWFKSTYLDTNAYVHFWAAWPVGSDKPDARPLALGGKGQPVILMQSVGANGGKVVLIGDSDFAMNKNTEWENGAPIEGVRENSDFWRWFIEYLKDPDHPPTTNPTTPPAAQGNVSTQSEVSP